MWLFLNVLYATVVAVY